MKSPERYPTIGWEWDDNAASTTSNKIESPAGVRYEFVAGQAPCITQSMPPGWSASVPYQPGLNAVMAANKTHLYVALHSGAGTGCKVVALDQHDGSVAWKTQLIGLGSVGHSKYCNRVQLRLGVDHLAVYGNESAGCYTEILKLVDGTRLLHEAVLT